MPTAHYIAWWNLENLFDSVNADRPEWLKRKLKKELNGWTTTVLNKKLDQLASIINTMNNNQGPDFLGVCEVENQVVLEKLVSRLNVRSTYQIAHHDTSDNRGIDVAFIFDSAKYTADEQFHYVVRRRNATRDIFQVNFTTTSGATLICIGHHWPSRSGGQYSSEPYRIIAAETTSYWMTRIPEHQGGDVAILHMGDFNDEPFNRSMREYALSIRNQRRVSSPRSQKPYLFNCMWELMAKGKGTFYYDRWNMLDQFLINKKFFGSQASFEVKEVDILQDGRLLKNSKPRKFGRPSASKSFDEDGYSDHFPITLKLQEE